MAGLPVDFSVFSGVIDALEKSVKGLIAATDLPNELFEKYRDAAGETFTLLDSALLLVYNRLGDLINIVESPIVESPEDNPRDEFIMDLQSLNNWKDWDRIERDVRLCSNLRAAHQDIDGLTLKVAAGTYGLDWENTRKLVDEVLEREGTLAKYISNALQELAQQASVAARSDGDFQRVLRTVKGARKGVGRERDRLINLEIEFHKTF